MCHFAKKLLTILIAAGFVAAHSSPAIAKTYTIDASHSTIGFAVKHLQVGTTRGVFTDYTGEITFDADDLAAFKADVTIKADSVDTNNEKRDGHLKTADFFDTANNANITFGNGRLAKLEDGYSILGDLTIRGVTKTISIPVTIIGPTASPFGGTVLGIAGSTTINRQDFGVSWNKSMDNGGFVVSDAVDLTVEIEASAQ